MPAIGAVFFGPLIYFFAREAKGHGVPEVMEAMELKGGRIRPIVGAIKALASSICISSGGSVGREGPIVQIGSAIGSTIGQKLRFSDDKVKILVAGGAASGIAATFNAPLGGVFFALEVILRNFSTRRLGGVVVAAVMASVIAKIFLGGDTSIPVPPYALGNPLELLFYLVFGLLLVPLCILFIRSIYKFEDLFKKLPIHELSKPIIGGLLLGGIGFFYPQVFGVGYENIEHAVDASMPLKLMALLILLKLIAVSLTLGSGGSGGIFAPSLVLGALIGGSFGTILSYFFPQLGIEPGAYALVGMGAFFAGAARAPITSIVLLFELTGDYLIILPLMLTVAITTIAAERVHPESIYTLKLTRKGINIRKQMRRDILEHIKVSEILKRDMISVPPSAPMDAILPALAKGSHRTLPVIGADGTFYGIITVNQIFDTLEHMDSLKDLIIAQDLAQTGASVKESDNLNDALNKFLESECEVLPVIKKEQQKVQVMGIISRDDLLSAYSREVSIKRESQTDMSTD
ncbi:chloride channel protein [Planctomycetota bacterium]